MHKESSQPGFPFVPRLGDAPVHLDDYVICSEYQHLEVLADDARLEKLRWRTSQGA
jgi:hypothetical protein